MKVFISWSGDFSREVAEQLSQWIPSVIQSVEIFFSPDDIGKGENWDNKLSKELNESNFGIICLTPENVAAPWIHFEAGSLAKAVDSRLSAIMFCVNVSDIKGPLSRFQNTKFEKNDVFKLMQTINVATEAPLKNEILAYTFDVMWDQLDRAVSPIIKKYQSNFHPKKEETDDREAIQEILSIVRKMSKNFVDTEIAPSQYDVDMALSNMGLLDSYKNALSRAYSRAAFEPNTQVIIISKRNPEIPLSDETKAILNTCGTAYVIGFTKRVIRELDEIGMCIFRCKISDADFMTELLSALPELVISRSERSK